MPVLSTILGIAAVAASGVGIAEQAKSQGIQQKGEKDQNLIAQQEMQDKQKSFDEAQAFYSPYTKTGSPFLQQIQSAAAGQNAQAGNNAAGTLRAEMSERGVGFGPSGSTAGALSNLAAENSATGQSNYLQNLLQNEQLKFQAQQGLTQAGSMAGATQNQPSVSTQIPAASTTGAIGAAGNALAGATGGSSSSSGGANIPTIGQVEQTQIPASSVLTPPTPTGWNI